ncbi:transcription regulator hth lysr [Lucifera butyrica]|uniref:Transcription regulator hth lysr n=1 Tax=Lucifera butyrica TaxID=1351585 RepID=A0A498R577_9FIRM|nr:LysR family transcriptional regulator [Lucifera butyrica]VBB05977.1 transcription regulator hth lysr [Lucifera butyrica]
MNLQHLYYFKAVARMEHYGKAAEELMTSQSGISYAITALEEELGVPLFHKYGRNVRITKYGKVFLEYVEDVISRLEAGIQEMHDLRQPNLQTAVIACMESLSTQYIVELIKLFKASPASRDICFELLQMDTMEMLEGMKAGNVSLGFGNRIDDKDVVSIPIYSEKFVLIVPLGHRLADCQAVDLPDIKNEEFIFFCEGLHIQKLIDNIFQSENLKIHSHYRAATDSMVAQFVESGLGVALIPHSQRLQSYQVQAVELKNCEYRREICMNWLKGSELLTANKKLRDFILSHYEKLNT